MENYATGQIPSLHSHSLADATGRQLLDAVWSQKGVTQERYEHAHGNRKQVQYGAPTARRHCSGARGAIPIADKGR